MMKGKSWAVVYKGRNVWVSNFGYEGFTAYGRIQGVDVSVEIGAKIITDNVAARMLIEKKFAEYGDVPLTPKERANCAIHVGGYIVEDTHVYRNGDGSALAVGKVNGKRLSINYDCVAFGKYGNTDGKPYLHEVREDLVKAYETQLEDEKSQMYDLLVDDAFFRRLENAKGMRIEIKDRIATVEGIEMVDLSRCETKKQVILLLMDARKKVMKRHDEEMKFIEDFMREIGA